MGQVGGGCPGWSTIVYVSSGMFRGKESLNRIELSRLVQDLLNFGDLGSLRLCGVGVGGWEWGWLGGWVDGDGGWLRGAPHTHAHVCACTHTHACTCMCGKHDNFMQMAAPMGNTWEFPMMSYACVHACTCMHVHMCGGHPLATSYPHPPTHPPPRGDPRNQSKFNSIWTNQDISILFKDLKSVETPPLMGGCIVWWVGGWVGGWVDGWGHEKTKKI